MATCSRCHLVYPFPLPPGAGIEWTCASCRAEDAPLNEDIIAALVAGDLPAAAERYAEEKRRFTSDSIADLAAFLSPDIDTEEDTPC